MHYCSMCCSCQVADTSLAGSLLVLACSLQEPAIAGLQERGLQESGFQEGDLQESGLQESGLQDTSSRRTCHLCSPVVGPAATAAAAGHGHSRSREHQQTYKSECWKKQHICQSSACKRLLLLCAKLLGSAAGKAHNTPAAGRVCRITFAAPLQT